MTRSERQNLAIEKWKEANCFGTWEFCTGFGKTFTTLTAIKRVLSKNPTLKVVVVVPTIVLKNQWEEKIENENLEAAVEVKVLMTAAKHQFYCDFLIIDEIHKAAGNFTKNIFENCNPKLILGLTATYERLDGQDKIILDKYCPICDSISVKEATQNGWLSPYIEYKVLLDVDTTEYDKANQTFLSHFAFFDFSWDDAMGSVSNAIFRNKYAKSRNINPKEVAAHAFAWNKALQFRKSFIANHPKKIEIAKKIIEARKDKKIITFNSSIKQCEAYGEGYVIHSQNKKKENDEMLKKFSKAISGQIHSSKMLIEGLDCPGLSVAIITGFNSSQTNRRQSIGRVIRAEPNKTAEVFTLVLKGCQDERWYKTAMVGLNFIEINEEELDKVLNYEELINKKEQTSCKKEEFRF